MLNKKTNHHREIISRKMTKNGSFNNYSNEILIKDSMYDEIYDEI